MDIAMCFLWENVEKVFGFGQSDVRFDHVYMIVGVTRHMLPHLSGVPHLHVNRP